MKCEFCGQMLNDLNKHKNRLRTCNAKRWFMQKLNEKTILKSPYGRKIWISGAGRIILMIRGEKFSKNWFKSKILKNDDGTAKALNEFEQKNKLWFWEDKEQNLFCIKHSKKAGG